MIDRRVPVTSEQIRAARALLRWEQRDLAEASGVSLPTIKRLETQPGPLAAYASTSQALREALELAGIVFVTEGSDGYGVRLMRRLRRDTEEDTGMKMSDGEKLILVMLSQIHKRLEIADGVDPDFITEVICEGNLWALEDRYHGIFGNAEPDRDMVREVSNIMDMWMFIEIVAGKLSAQERKILEGLSDPVFCGFDGNGEADYLSIAVRMVKEPGRFDCLKGRDLNSHCPSIDAHRRMIEVWMELRPQLAGRDLNVGDIKALLEARVHPDYKKSAN